MTPEEIQAGITATEAQLRNLRAQLVLATDTAPNPYAAMNDAALAALKQQTLAEIRALPAGSARDAKRQVFSAITRSAVLRAAAAEVAT